MATFVVISWIYLLINTAISQSHNGTFIAAMIQQSHILNDSNYQTNFQYYKTIYIQIERRMMNIQLSGNPIPCSYQLSVTINNLLSYTNKWNETKYYLNKFNESLNDLNQTWASLQQSNGSYGPCYPYFSDKLSAISHAINYYQSTNTLPKYPFKFINNSILQNITTLLSYLNNILISDIISTGIDHRYELNSYILFISQVYLINGQYINNNSDAFGWYIPNEYANEWLIWLDNIQNNESAFWGSKYLYNGTIYSSDDLSITINVIKCRINGGYYVKYMNKILNWTLEAKYYPYPFGWGTNNDNYTNYIWNSNYHNYEIVNLFYYSWNYSLNNTLKSIASLNIQNMLDWTLTSESIIEINNGCYNWAYMNCSGMGVYSISDCYYFGIEFMKRIGYYQRNNEFWSNETFGNTMNLCCQLKSTLNKYHFDDIITNCGYDAVIEYNLQCSQSVCTYIANDCDE